MALQAREKRLRLAEARELQSQRGGLYEFVQYFWHILEPKTEMVEGWPMVAICHHLEAIARREINRLLITVPPGFCKSLLTDVFFPAWLWSAFDEPHARIVAFSYAALLTERDNGKFRDLLMSQEFREVWGHKFNLTKIGETKIANSRTGWKLASSIGGVGTGERGNFVLLDDPHNLKDMSDDVRKETVRWFREAMSNRLNDMETDCIIVIMQRSHAGDVAGSILDTPLMGYTILSIEMEFDPGRATAGMPNKLGWIDPRAVDEDGYVLDPQELSKRRGMLAWPERFPRRVCDAIRSTIQIYAWAAQYQQTPSPRGGGIIKQEWWMTWNQQEASRYGREWDDSSHGRKEFPHFELICASLDTAYGLKQTNDFSALTVWGIWVDMSGNRRAMLMYAWAKRLPLHGVLLAQNPGEPDVALKRRREAEWGLIELVADTCRRYKVRRLLIEDKNRGRDVAEEINRLYAREQWGVELVNPVKDKVSRTHSIVPLFTDGVIWAPETTWSDQVLQNCSEFPKATHDDLHDTVTQFLNWARENGILIRGDEYSAALEADAQYEGRQDSVAANYGV